MNDNVTSLDARRRSTTVEDAITSRHAAVIADYLQAKLDRNAGRMTEIRGEAASIDAEYPGFPSLVAQLDALRPSQAA
ncbi:hypothetical protein ACFV9E_06330 [Streptomyces sp. NPDC059835]|uniref:hypothetical protein n=1 Tax=Streptomyces sp. NPDC059835 TaxID=3346967 RepID=UPI00364FFC94